MPKAGRPQKTRKKSAGELCMVKDGKLSRKGKSVTCVLCKCKGHNKRSCKAPSQTGASAGQNGGSKRKISTNATTGGSETAFTSKKRKNEGPSQTTGTQPGASQASQHGPTNA